MKKLLLLFMIFPAFASAQEVSVRRTEQITKAAEGEFIISEVSHDGRLILASSSDFRGLKIIDLKKKTIQDITTDAGAGYEPVFSDDGDIIYFRSDEYRNLRKYSSLQEYTRSTGKTLMVEPPARGLGSPVISGGKLFYIADGRQKSGITGMADSHKGGADFFVMLEDLVPVLYLNGVRKELKPNGEGNYIWASLSPDRTKLVYNYRGTSTFVSDTSGRILAELGRLNAPRWINDYLIAGMNDEDDGTRVLQSDICCYSLRTNKLYNLTRSVGVIEMYPRPVPGRNRIAFQTQTGELFLMHIKIW